MYPSQMGKTNYMHKYVHGALEIKIEISKKLKNCLKGKECIGTIMQTLKRL